MRTTTWRRWVIAGLVTVLLAGAWSTPTRASTLGAVVDAITGLGSLFGGGTAAIIANQVTQIGHMVTQIQTMSDVLADTNEVLTSQDIGMGNIGRVREVNDALWWFQRDGNGLATSPDREGSFSQRIVGVTDQAGWLNVLAAPRLGDPASATVLLGGRPATETTPAEPSAFRTWRIPRGGEWSRPGRTAAREAIDVLGDVAEGTATWRTVWDDIEATLPDAVTAADLRALRLGADVTDRLVDEWRRRERRAGANLQHAHAIAEAASTLNAQVGETAAHLATLRDDDLMREQRVDQALLANGVTQTELLLAQAQLLAQQQARKARERYEAERRRREEQAEWQAEMAQGVADWQARRADILAQRAARIAAHRRVPDPSRW